MIKEGVYIRSRSGVWIISFGDDMLGFSIWSSKAHNFETVENAQRCAREMALAWINWDVLENPDLDKL